VTPILLDTGFIVALLDRSERHHAACKQIVQGLSAPLITCEAVLAEACFLLRGLAGAPEAVLKNVEDGIFQVPFRLSAASRSVRILLKKYAGVPMDLADACLVCLADEAGTGEILTLDSDFRVYRWRKNRRFELLVSPMS
jgi:predicted nucleic acid-binding protein